MISRAKISMELAEYVEMFIVAIMPIYIASFLLYTVRIFKGPTIADIVLAVDALSYDLAAFLVILGILLRSPIMLPCAIVLVLWIYALDIYVAKYLEAGELGE